MQADLDIAAGGLPPVDEPKSGTLTSPPPPVHEPTAVTLTPEPPPVAPEDSERVRVLVVAPRGDDSGISATVTIRRPHKAGSSKLSPPPPFRRG
jgi:hypothetical protein